LTNAVYKLHCVRKITISVIIIIIIIGVSFSSYWKWVVWPQALKKMGNATYYANNKWVARSDNKIVFNNHKTVNTHAMCICSMNRCGHLYMNITYSKHCLH